MANEPPDPIEPPTVAELALVATNLRTSLADTREWLMSLRPTTSRMVRIAKLEHAEKNAAQLERVLSKLAAGGLRALSDGSYVDSAGNTFRAVAGGGWELLQVAAVAEPEGN